MAPIPPRKTAQQPLSHPPALKVPRVLSRKNSDSSTDTAVSRISNTTTSASTTSSRSVYGPSIPIQSDPMTPAQCDSPVTAHDRPALDPSLRPWKALWEPKAANIKYYVDGSEDDCRAYRRFPADRFLWLQLPQEIFERQSKIKEILQTTFTRTDDNGVPHEYEFLGTTDSKLKDTTTKVVGFFESSPDCTSCDVLNSFGDLQSVLERHGAGKYIARLTLSFSTTIDVGELGKHGIAKLKDVKNEDGSKIFTDGCGVISRNYAEEISEKLKLQHVPSVFQFRYGGCKGILVTYDTALLMRLFPGRFKSYHSIGLRPSHRKYKAPECINLEINDWSKPRTTSVRLTRSLILVLSTQGVELQVFENLLTEHLEKMKAALEDRGRLERYLELDENASLTSLDFTPKNTALRMLAAGFDLKEPYLQDNLNGLFKGSLRYLTKKLCIPMPNTAYLYGVVDESGILEGNEVYVCITGSYDFAGAVMVTRNPNGHPGDVRLCIAKVPPIGHCYRDCIVFPQKGDQPLPDQMAGGDLDGDEYLVSWNEHLFPKRLHKASPRISPPSKPRAEIIEIDHPPKDPRKAMIDHLAVRMGNFGVGKASKLWEDAANRAKQGVKDPYCLAMWDRYEACLDVNKSGEELPPIPDDSQKGELLPPDQLGPIESLRKMIPESLGQQDADYELDKDLIYNSGSPEWECDVAAFRAVSRLYWSTLFAEEGKMNGKGLDGKVPRQTEAPTVAAQEKADKVRTVIREFVERQRKACFPVDCHPNEHERHRVRASAFYFAAYDYAAKAQKKACLELAWLGLPYLTELKSRWIVHRAGGFGPAASVVSMDGK